MELDVAVDFFVPGFVANIDLSGVAMGVDISGQASTLATFVEIGRPGDTGPTGPTGPAGVGFITPDKQSAFNKFRTLGQSIGFVTTTQTVANRLVAYPVRLPTHGLPITQCQVQCGTAVAGAIVRVGIYEVVASGSDIGGLGEPLVATCQFDLSTTGVKSASLNEAILADGRVVILAVHTNAAVGMRFFGAAWSWQSIIQDSMYNNFSDAVKYTSTVLTNMPNSLPALPNFVPVSSMPFVAMGVS